MESCKSLATITFVVGVLVLFQSGYGSALHVRIDNGVGPKIEAHCKSNDGTDAASGTINNSAYWMFSIWPNTQRTRYECSFRWAGESHYLTIYDQWRGLELGSYHWSLNEDGGCLLVDSVGTWQCYSWKQSA